MLKYGDLMFTGTEYLLIQPSEVTKNDTDLTWFE